MGQGPLSVIAAASVVVSGCNGRVDNLATVTIRIVGSTPTAPHTETARGASPAFAKTATAGERGTPACPRTVPAPGRCPFPERQPAFFVAQDSGPAPVTTVSVCPPGRTLPPVGPCTPPVRTCFANRACSDKPDAPGAEGCGPSALDEYGTHCCYGTSCGIDYGKGCFNVVKPVGQTASLGSACSGDPQAPGRLYASTNWSSTTMNGGVLFTLEGSGTLRLIEISKQTCSSSVLYESSDVFDTPAATEEAVYVAPRASSIVEVPLAGGGSPHAVDLSALLGSSDVQYGPLGSDGKNAYAAARINTPRVSSPYVLVELPCCGAPPKIIATTATSFFGGVADQLVPAGNRIYEFGVQLVLDSAPFTSLGFVDLGTGQATAIFDNAEIEDLVFPLGVHDGLPYLAQGGHISTIDPTSCALGSVVNGVADSISAFASSDHAIYWAETYSALPVSRVYTMADGTSSVVRVIETSGQVTWLGVDATHLYWAEHPADGSDYSVSRIALRR